MKKTFILITLLCLFIGIPSVSAATVTSAVYENGKLKISGTGEKQAQIVIFDSDNKPIYMTTATVTDGKFEITLPEIKKLVDGNYVVKVGDYDGKNVASKEVTVKQGTTSNPYTFDNISIYIILGIISVIGIIFSKKFLKKQLYKNSCN